MTLIVYFAALPKYGHSNTQEAVVRCTNELELGAWGYNGFIVDTNVPGLSKFCYKL